MRYLILCALLAAALAHGLSAIEQTGITCDEPIQREYGKVVLAFHESTGSDTRAFSLSNMRLYGGGFELLGAVLERAFPELDYRLLRHALSVVFGVIGLLFTFLLTRRFGGDWAGLLAVVLLSCTPRWTGHALFNPKDIPFAAMHLIAVFTGVRVLDEFPRPRLMTWILFGVGSGIALSVRIGGLFPMAYMLLFFALLAWRNVDQWWSGSLVALVLCYMVAGATWPFLLSNPISHTIFALWQNARFAWNGPLLFDGQVIMAADESRLYIPQWFAITAPLALFFAPLGLRRLFKASLPGRYVLISAFFMPVYAVITRARAYDEVRQFLFLVPFLAMAAALAITSIRKWRPALAVVVTLMVLEPAYWIANNTQHMYTYFNPLVGGLAKASWRYESDYWWNALRVGAEWCNNYARGEPLRVYLTNGSPQSFTPFAAPNVKLVGTREESDVEIVWQRYVLPSALPTDTLFRYAPVEGQAPFFVIVKTRT